MNPGPPGHWLCPRVHGDRGEGLDRRKTWLIKFVCRIVDYDIYIYNIIRMIYAIDAYNIIIYIINCGISNRYNIMIYMPLVVCSDLKGPQAKSNRI